jgi:hypothetical protein
VTTRESSARRRVAQYGHPWLDTKKDRQGRSRYGVHLWNGRRRRRAIIVWVAFFGPLPRRWYVHHLRPDDTLSDWPLRDTLALPSGTHMTVHRELNRNGQQPQALLDRYRAYWLERVANRRTPIAISTEKDL